MKKILFLFFIFLLAYQCASNDDTQEEETEQVNPNDIDGDGVTNQQEVVDNTSPDDPCDFRQSSQYYPSISNAWKALDCDGDGVTNWKELDPDGDNTVNNNGTSPLVGCSFVLSDRTLEPTDEWKSLNCDSDFVSNGQEEIDNTNVLDGCDFITESQDLEPFDYWLEEDCDNDGRTNSRELNDGTDLLDPTDFDGAGTILKEIYKGTKSNYTEKYTFLNDGTLFDKVFDSNDNIIVDFQYDYQNRLVTYINNTDNYSITYDYNANNEITQITIDDEGDIYSYSLVHDGNIVYAYDGNQPPGLYTIKFTFNNQNKLIHKQTFLSSVDVVIETYDYDANSENLLSSFSESLGYNPETGETFSYSWYTEISKDYSYSYQGENLVNIFFNPYQNIINNIFLLPNPSPLLQHTFFPNLGATSTDFETRYLYNGSTLDGTIDYGYLYGAHFTESNELPSKLGWGHIEGGASYEVHYEN
ncbi:hypothetical protein AB9K26_04825 [Psychroserpens sp. XS_ASV72]|uniref:hypothetical protein n=1 Tax=Psychroserpens sp. XS_ASV72 TaxID=3241293 RepID=UPI003512C490